MKKLTALLLAIVICLTLVACGDKEPTEPSSTPSETTAQETVKREPKANVDPVSMEWGMKADNDYTSDFWFPENGNKTEYILFQNTSSEYAPAGCSYIKIINGKETLDFACAVDNEGNLIDASNTGKIKIAFLDNFTAYDYVAEVWYSRGDMQALNDQLSGKKLISENYPEDTLELKADGTTAELYEDYSYTGTWELAAASVVNVTQDGSDYVKHFTINYDENGKITGISEGSLSTYVFA